MIDVRRGDDVVGGLQYFEKRVQGVAGAPGEVTQQGNPILLADRCIADPHLVRGSCRGQIFNGDLLRLVKADRSDRYDGPPLPAVTWTRELAQSCGCRLATRVTVLEHKHCSFEKLPFVALDEPARERGSDQCSR